MTDLIIALGIAGFLAIILILGRTAITAFDEGCRAIRNRAGHDRELHYEQVTRLITDMGAERREWAQERAVLLNRIADPANTAFASTVAMIPPASEDMSMEVTR